MKTKIAWIIALDHHIVTQNNVMNLPRKERFQTLCVMTAVGELIETDDDDPFITIRHSITVANDSGGEMREDLQRILKASILEMRVFEVDLPGDDHILEYLDHDRVMKTLKRNYKEMKDDHLMADEESHPNESHAVLLRQKIESYEREKTNNRTRGKTRGE